MDLKNALIVCLISFFSATLVVLIARSLDVQAASRLEPQLEQIATELATIRKMVAGGRGLAAGESAGTIREVVVYYLHRSTRCPTCERMESLTHKAVVSGFPEELAAETLRWKTVNCEKPGGKRFTTAYKVVPPTVVLVETIDGTPGKWKHLDEVGVFLDDEAVFTDYVRNEIRAMLGGEATDGPGTAADTEEPVEESVEIGPSTEGESDVPPLPVPVVPE